MSEQSAPRHVPVMLERVLALLAPALEAPGSVVVDATLGLGGHSEALLGRTLRCGSSALDPDGDALALTETRLAPYAERTSFVHAVYDELPDVLADLGLDRVQGVLFDLGVSSMQLDEAGRGFAYAQDAPLDMRMDASRRCDRRGDRQHLFGGRRSPGCCASTARSGSPVGSPTPWSASGEREPFDLLRPPGRAGPHRRSPRRPAAPEVTPPSAPSRRCGSRSTASSRRSSGRCLPRSMRSPWAVGSSSCPTSRSRTASSSAC